MPRALSLQECMSGEGAFRDPDPMVRLAAAHHAGRLLERGAGDPDRLRPLLQAQLQDRDRRVACCAAVSLARAGVATGVESLCAWARAARAGERPQVLACLRDCTPFPFAVLLGVLGGDGVPAAALGEAAALTEEAYRQRVAGEPRFNERVLDALCKRKGRDGSACVRGLVLARPRGDQPGLLAVAERAGFLAFTEEAVLNAGDLRAGDAAVCVAQRGEWDGALALLGLEGVPAGSLDDWITEEELPGGLVPGLVEGTREAGGERVLAILCRDGRTVEEPEAAHPGAVAGRLALVTPERAPAQRVFLAERHPARATREAVLTEGTRRALVRELPRLAGPDHTQVDRMIGRLAALGRSAVEALVGELAKALPKAELRAGAAHALSRVGEPAVEALMDALLHRDRDVRRAAAGALAGMDTPVLRVLLEKVAPLKGSKKDRLALAVGAFAAVWPRLAAGELDREVLAVAARVNNRAFDALVEGTLQPDRAEQEEPIFERGEGRDAGKAAQALVELFWLAPDCPATEPVVARIGDPAAGHLRRAQADPDPEVRRLAGDALARLSSRAPAAVAPGQPTSGGSARSGRLAGPASWKCRVCGAAIPGGASRCFQCRKGVR